MSEDNDRESIELLRASRAAVFERLVEMVASQQGVDITKGGVRRTRIEDKVEKMTENWMAADNHQPEGLSPYTPLQKLLAAYHEIGERILDIHDGVAEQSRTEEE